MGFVMIDQHEIRWFCYLIMEHWNHILFHIYCSFLYLFSCLFICVFHRFFTNHARTVYCKRVFKYTPFNVLQKQYFCAHFNGLLEINWKVLLKQTEWTNNFTQCPSTCEGLIVYYVQNALGSLKIEHRHHFRKINIYFDHVSSVL